MNTIQKYNASKATVCVKNTCATVYGETANIVNAIVVVAAITASVLLVAKLARTL